MIPDFCGRTPSFVGELGALHEQPEFRRRTQFFADKLKVLKATLGFVAELEALWAGSTSRGRTWDIANELGFRGRT